MRLRTLLAAAAALPFAATPANAADADAFVLFGSGTISPGTVVVRADPQVVSFAATATVVGTHGVPGTFACSFSGTLVASVAGGTGTMAGGCGPLWFAPCTVVAVVDTWTVACAGPGRPAAFACALQRTDVRPTTRYTVSCAGTIAQA